MEARRSQMTDVEAKVSVEELMAQITTAKTMETDLSRDVEDPVAKVSLEEQMKQITISNNTLEKNLAHDFEDGNLKPLDDDDEGKALRLLFEDEEDKKFKALAKLFFYQPTEEAEGIGGGGDAFGANCWFD